MASTPASTDRLQFIIKKYPNGAFSGLLDGNLTPGTALKLRGPYGTCMRRENRDGPMILVGGGSGMSPLLSILEDQIANGPTRSIYFFYGARTAKDLFYLDRFAELAAQHPEFKFIPALSDAEAIHRGPARRVGFTKLQNSICPNLTSMMMQMRTYAVLDQ